MFGIPMLEAGYAIRCGNCNSANLRFYQEVELPIAIGPSMLLRGSIMADPKVTEAEGD